jgi:hypothetical protein
MARSEFPYRKLPGDYRGFFRSHSLWLGADHVLQVDSSRFSETYRRFYLTDIQAIIVRKAPRFVFPYYWVLLLAAAIIALIVVAAGSRHYSPWTGGIILTVLIGAAVYLYIASVLQSCTCHLITRVSNVELRSLFRLRAARKFVAMIAPRLQALQGNLPEGWVERSFDLAESLTAADRNPETLVSDSPVGAFSWFTVAVFVFVLIDAGLTGLQLRNPDAPGSTGSNVINMIALAICATISLVQLTRGKSGGPLRALVLAALLAVAGVNYGSVLIQSFDQQFYHRNFDKLFDYPGMRVLAISEILLDVVVAAAGLVLAFRRPQASQRPRSLFDIGEPGA